MKKIKTYKSLLKLEELHLNSYRVELKKIDNMKKTYITEIYKIKTEVKKECSIYYIPFQNYLYNCLRKIKHLEKNIENLNLEYKRILEMINLHHRTKRILSKNIDSAKEENVKLNLKKETKEVEDMFNINYNIKNISN